MLWFGWRLAANECARILPRNTFTWKKCWMTNASLKNEFGRWTGVDFDSEVFDLPWEIICARTANETVVQDQNVPKCGHNICSGWEACDSFRREWAVAAFLTQDAIHRGTTEGNPEGTPQGIIFYRGRFWQDWNIMFIIHLIAGYGWDHFTHCPPRFEPHTVCPTMQE